MKTPTEILGIARDVGTYLLVLEAGVIFGAAGQSALGAAGAVAAAVSGLAVFLVFGVYLTTRTP